MVCTAVATKALPGRERCGPGRGRVTEAWIPNTALDEPSWPGNTAEGHPADLAVCPSAVMRTAVRYFVMFVGGVIGVAARDWGEVAEA